MTGTQVKAYNLPIPLNSTFQMKVWAIQPTCGAGPSAGGYSVFLDLYVNGSWQGWISYGRLDQVQVSAGQVIGQNTVLGYLRNWGYTTGCYEVNNDAGVHTHYGQYNKDKYACYYEYQMGQQLSYSAFGLGEVGRLA